MAWYDRHGKRAILAFVLSLGFPSTNGVFGVSDIIFSHAESEVVQSSNIQFPHIGLSVFERGFRIIDIAWSFGRFEHFLFSDQKKGYQNVCFASMDINIPKSRSFQGKRN